jgi:hypothetical protein
MIKKLFFIGSVSISLASCKSGGITTLFESSTVPMYVTAGELASLNTGMSKQEAKAKLGELSPFDILVSQGDGCEVHHYKYKKPAKELSAAKADKAEGLTEGTKKFKEESNAFLVYKNGKLESVLTDAGKSDAVNVLKSISAVQGACSEAGLKGCTDPKAINYNPNAIIDDGSAEYCPCGYEENPNFNPKRPVSDCNQKCIKIATEEDKKSETQGNGCTNCEIIDKLSKSNSNIHINLDLNAAGTNNAAASTKSTGEKKSLGVLNNNKSKDSGSDSGVKGDDQSQKTGATKKKLVRIN